MDTVEIRHYINQVIDQLDRAGIPTSHVRIDPPEVAAELGRDWACIDLAGEQGAYSLVWSDWRGWLVSTFADNYPALPGQVSPAPADVVREARAHIHTLTHGGWVRALRTT